jgi:flagellar biosynthesis protein FliR
LLDQLLTTNIYWFFIVFCRVGSTIMLLPGFSGSMLNTRSRLVVALAITLIMTPVIGPRIPPAPSSPAALALLMLGEVTVGVYLGMVGQALMSSIHVAGTFIGTQTGLSNAFAFDEVVEQQSQLLTSLFSNLALALIFATDLHHLMLRAIADSYDLFQPGAPLMMGDFTQTLTRMVASAFSLGIRLSAPVLVFGLVFYSGLGLLSRMVPQMQVFFIAQPAQILFGLWMMLVSLPMMVLFFLRSIDAGWRMFLTP